MWTHAVLRSRSPEGHFHGEPTTQFLAGRNCEDPPSRNTSPSPTFPEKCTGPHSAGSEKGSEGRP